MSRPGQQCRRRSSWHHIGGAQRVDPGRIRDRWPIRRPLSPASTLPMAAAQQMQVATPAVRRSTVVAHRRSGSSLRDDSASDANSPAAWPGGPNSGRGLTVRLRARTRGCRFGPPACGCGAHRQVSRATAGIRHITSRAARIDAGQHQPERSALLWMPATGRSAAIGRA